MSVWKQSAVCVAIAAAAVAGWVYFHPGAPKVLTSLGIGWAPAAKPDRARRDEGPRGGIGGGAVVTAPIETATLNDRLSAIGTGRSLRSVVVTPFSSGRVTGVYVDSGARVAAGDVIAELDSDSERIALDRARLALEDARARLERQKRLRASNTVTSVQVNEAALEVRKAELALREAELTLDRRSIRAPIAGVVGILPVTVGQYVTSDTDIATIDDRSRILIDFWVPERFAGMIEPGQELSAASIARPGEVFTGTVSALDNRIDPESRTLHVEARIINPDDRLRAGMAFRVGMRFPGDTYPAVDPLAIQWNTDGAYVWAVEDGRARRTPVRIVQRNSDRVLVDGAFQEADLVVVQGVQNVRDGELVLIAGREHPGPGAGGAADGSARGS